MAKMEKGEALLLLPGRFHAGPPPGKPLGSSPALAIGSVAASDVDGAWVGTWRPHRPRGPIMAQFTSPGPKYSIPGTTGYLVHNPTKTKAPAYTFQRAKPPGTDSCSPGPRYYVQPSITRNGKYVAPAQHMGRLPKIMTEVTPGPSDYSTDKANQHLYKCVPSPSMAFRHKAFKTSETPGPGTYTLPRLVGPNTAYTHASPCYSMKGKSKHNSFAEDLAKTPGPAAFPKVEVDTYKKRAPVYTMGSKSGIGGGKTVKPGPADYCPGKVTLIKPQAPAPTFGLRHSLYTTPLLSLQ
ncbi:outer dense fiber protein 3-like [Accipiter gentilis]|uniref:outer dense fiber protein 3-like n=1 Tax=Astur gentilis TaxID=8957 RepID=UPI00210FC592|nr:outer dense fiber protein 3-like [Accipiter gentilis]